MSWMCPWQGCLVLPHLSRAHPAGVLLRCPPPGSSSLGKLNMWYAVAAVPTLSGVSTVDVAASVYHLF